MAYPINIAHKLFMASASVLGLMAWGGAALAEVPNDNYNPNRPPILADPNAVNGIGAVITDTGGGYVGVCTGSLINPRTVLFAAHCVNMRRATDYGSLGGGTPISVGFKGNAFTGMRGWFNSDYATSYVNQHYNMSRVFYDPLSLQDVRKAGFYEADMAIGVLDSPAKNVPTWAMLFSPLTGAENRHVTTGGYGRSGIGSLGQVQGIDFRRRAAENMIGALASLDDIALWFYGEEDVAGLSQNLYMVDFDDPKGKAVYDINVFGDDLALPREGMTAPGDSGGPLILDQAFDTPVIAGVLSLDSWYFRDQPRGSYGATAGYQPLYLFTDWIVANNPYKYVAAKGGDGDWFDPAHWVQMMDPNYKIIGPNGKLMTGLPDTPSEGVGSRGGEWGSICWRGDCASAKELADYNHAREDRLAQGGSRRSSDEQHANNALIVDVHELVGAASGRSRSEAGAAGDEGGGVEAAAVGTAPGATRSFELLPGGPGSTNFVPYNVNGDVRASENPLFYDVNLTSAGVTTLKQKAVIDRLTVGATGAVLDIAKSGMLYAENDVSVWGGRLNVDGALATYEMLLAGGMLSGSGVVDSTVLTSVLGSIAPGGQGQVGQLTLLSDLVLASGSRLFIDIGGDGADRLVVRADALENTTGAASLGGLLGLSLISAPQYGRTYTVLTAEGGVQGRFSSVTDVPGVLYPVLNYRANAVDVQMKAASYLDFINPASPAQRTVGGLLDAARDTRYAALGEVYAQTDVLEGQALGAGLESLSPYGAHSGVTLMSAQTEALRGVVDGRIARDRSSPPAEGLALIGSGVQVAALNPAATAAAAGLAVRQAEAQAERARWSGWKPGVSAYFGVGAIEGEAAQLRGGLGDSRSDDQSAWYVVGGLERTVDALTLGAGLAYAEGESDFAEGVSKTDSRQLQANLYGALDLSHGAYVGAKLGYAVADLDTERTATVGGAALRAKGETDGTVVSGGAELGFNLKSGPLKVQPNIGVDAYSVDLDGYSETGGAAALAVADQSFESLQHHLGLRIGGQTKVRRWTITPALDLRWVHELAGDDRSVEAGFVAADAFCGVFTGAAQDQEWAEAGGTVAIQGDRFGVVLKAASMIDREDLDYQTYSATMTMRF